MSKVMLRKIMLGALCAIFAACMALCCVFAMAPASNVAAEGSGEGSASGAEDELIVYEGSTFYDWASMKTYIESLPAGSDETVIVGADMTADSNITVPDGVKIILTSANNDENDAKVIIRAASYTGSFFTVGTNTVGETVNLTLQHIILDGGSVNTTNGSLLVYYCNSDSYIEDGAILRNNYSSNGNGSAIYVGSVSNKGGKVTMNAGLITGNKITTRRTSGNGGTINLTRGGRVSTVVNPEHAPGEFIMNGGEISYNASLGQGAAFMISGKATVTGGKIIHNTANQDTCFYVVSSRGQLVINDEKGDNLEVAYNYAEVSVGIAAIYGSSTINGGVYHHNGAGNRMGGFYINGNITVNLNGITMYENYIDGTGDVSAMCGGAAIYMGNGTLNLYNGVFYNNYIKQSAGTAWGGGFIRVTAGTTNIYDCEVYNNSAPEDGGAFYLLGGTVNLYDGVFRDNSAGGSGSGIYMQNGTFNMYGGTFEGNSAGETGGAVYIANCLGAVVR